MNTTLRKLGKPTNRAVRSCQLPMTTRIPPWHFYIDNKNAKCECDARPVTFQNIVFRCSARTRRCKIMSSPSNKSDNFLQTSTINSLDLSVHNILAIVPVHGNSLRELASTLLTHHCGPDAYQDTRR